MRKYKERNGLRKYNEEMKRGNTRMWPMKRVNTQNADKKG